jgi:hypothetical protein
MLLGFLLVIGVVGAIITGAAIVKLVDRFTL